jgi:hypothetical protein
LHITIAASKEDQRRITTVDLMKQLAAAESVHRKAKAG